jgi:hypothetical protein
MSETDWVDEAFKKTRKDETVRKTLIEINSVLEELENDTVTYENAIRRIRSILSGIDIHDREVFVMDTMKRISDIMDEKEKSKKEI